MCDDARSDTPGWVESLTWSG